MSMADYEDGLKRAYEQPGAIAAYEVNLPEAQQISLQRILYLDSKTGEYLEVFDNASFLSKEDLDASALQIVTGDPGSEILFRRQQAIRQLIELDLQKPAIMRFFDEMKDAVAEVAKYIPLNGYFKDEDGTVFKLVKPGGQYVHFKDLDYERTKREGESRGTLSMKEAKDAEANNFQPLPEE